MRVLTDYLTVFLGAGLGGALRHAINRSPLATLAAFPLHTFAINLIGSFLMGILAGWMVFHGEIGQPTKLFLATGLLGGFTTFSSFTLELFSLWERGAILTANLYLLGSLAISIAAIAAGLAIMRP